jgi:hypothetical protein
MAPPPVADRPPGARQTGQKFYIKERSIMAAGRPTDYRPEFCERVIELGKEGYSKAMIAHDLDVTRNTLDNWAAVNPEFLSAIHDARDAALGWWELQGHKGIWSREFNANAYRLQVTNRFPDDWKDKQTTEHSNPDGSALALTVNFVSPKQEP